ncbi:hypothetical protein DV532_06065 [Pseudomonas sp. Leaf58]|nr:hypothetical protein DV532_06065 [Pseudomonas sp. Leaf58]
MPGSGHPQADGQGGKFVKNGREWLIRLHVYKLQATSFTLQKKAARCSACFFLLLEAYGLKLDWTGILHALHQLSGTRLPGPDRGHCPG